MSSDKQQFKNILCIRADNMGDLLMSSPAIRALKETFKASITVLTSSMAAPISASIAEIDDTICYDLPWVKTKNDSVPDAFFEITNLLKSRNFDLAVIFSVYSQNPLPAAMLAYLADIPVRLAYCRENPYQLLTHWVPDIEPYSGIKHQVKRDLDLVAEIGALPTTDQLELICFDDAWQSAKAKLVDQGIDLSKPWLILHAGVSEKKREYPKANWIELAKRIIQQTSYQVFFTGGPAEKPLTDELQNATGSGSFSLAGCFDLREFVELIRNTALIVSVNTGTTHIAAATQTPVIVLYALTNPQHSPWKANGKVLTFDVDEDLRSKNEVIRFVNTIYCNEFGKRTISSNEVLKCVLDILRGNIEQIPEMF